MKRIADLELLYYLRLYRLFFAEYNQVMDTNILINERVSAGLSAALHLQHLELK